MNKVMTLSNKSIRVCSEALEAIQKQKIKKGVAADEKSDISLDSFLIDENLKSIVNLALENNKDLRIALLRVEESKSLYRIEESNLYPKIDANGSFSRDKKEEIIKKFKLANFANDYQNLQTSVSIGLAALDKFKCGFTQNSNTISPLYLRKSQAERALEGEK